MIHGIGNSEESWNEVIKRLPDTIRVVTVDLLGFGKSPKPRWAMYNASTQARAVRKTLLQLGLFGKFHIVGHSLGSLVAIEMARRYKLANPTFYVDDSNVDSYMATLETMIINQTALRDVSRLRLPIHILRGVFDILVIPTHLGKLKKARKNISLHTVAAGHEIVGLYTHAVSDKVAAIVKK